MEADSHHKGTQRHHHQWFGCADSSFARAAAHANARETPDAASQEDLENMEDQVVGFSVSRGITVDKGEISACQKVISLPSSSGLSTGSLK